MASPKNPLYTVGCVSYVNAIPLVMRFEDAGESSPVRVIYDVPSRLPALLKSGEAQAILVSSIDSLRVPGRRMAAGVCIGSDGPVKSVRVFSKVAPNEIRSLAFDASSMTSNRLAQIVLAERYGVKPLVSTHKPDLEEMLAASDACVLIGDIGMVSDGTGLHVLDLGEEWQQLTGKPFVWAGWIGNETLTPELAHLLQKAAATAYVGRTAHPEGGETEEVRARLIARAQAHAPKWTPEMIRDYYLNVMVYEMDDHVLGGLEEFRLRLLRNGFEDCHAFPWVVG